MAAPPAPSGGPPKPGSKDIEEQTWYHGFRPRKDVMRLITQPGDFLVRATDTGDATQLVISGMDERRRTYNLTIRCDDKKLWYVGTHNAKSGKVRTFASVVDLIEYYKQHRLASKLKLSRPVRRPEWLIKHEAITYNTEKDRLGSGNFCQVFKGKQRLADGEMRTVAVKISSHSLNKSAKETEDAKQARASMIHEAELISYYAHDNVIQMFGVACDHPPVIVVMEFCPGGDLLTHLQKRGSEIELSEKALYAYESSRGMQYLHKMTCVHRDLAARNCLISEGGFIKISDFGMSKLLDEGPETKDDGVSAQVPVRWMAPESLREPFEFTFKTDVWSFGMLIYEIFGNGAKPWPDNPTKQIATHIRKGKMPALPPQTPEKFAKLVGKIWQLDPAKRPKFDVIAPCILDILRCMTLPPPEKLVINRIEGVRRASTTLQQDDSQESSDPSSGADQTMEPNQQKKKGSRHRERKTASNTVE